MCSFRFTISPRYRKDVEKNRRHHRLRLVSELH